MLVQRRITSWWLLLPLAFATWSLVHASGVHATVAGVLLGFAVPVRPQKVKDKDDDRPGMAAHFEHLWRPISAGVAVPVFALFSAGVAIGGWSGLQSAVTDPIAVGIIAGLVLGKPVGILTATYLTSKLTRRPLQKGLTWPDLIGVALLGGIGFTVSMLIGELAFGASSSAGDHVKIAVLTGSLSAALLAAVVLRVRNRRYRLLWEAENRDDDHDGIPDVYERE
jgi:NhaA family Na+:H+ antiporter